MNTSSAQTWFYAEGQERKGPVSYTTLQSLLAQGLPTSSLVWTEGMDEWLPASSFPELLSQGSSTPGNSSPYAPPSVDVSLPNEGGLETGPIPAQPIPLDPTFCISQAWKYTLANFGQIFLFGLVYFLVSLAVNGVLGGIASAMEPPRVQTTQLFDGSQITTQTSSAGPITIVVNIITQIFSIFLSLGATRFGHRLLKGESPEIGELFSQGSKLLNAIASTILFGIIVLIGLILLIIPGIWIALRCGLFMQVIVDKNLGPIEALKYSYELTRENALSLLGLYILCFLIGIAGILAVFIGLLWAIPTTWLATLIAYKYLHSGRNGIKVLT